MVISTATFRGEKWRVTNRRPGGEVGRCNWAKKIVAIPSVVETLAELDVALHEGLHACCPDLSEEAVDETATSLARLVWRLGWRNEP